MIILGVISGLLLGVLFGFALQRGRFCMKSAFTDIVLIKNYTLLKAIAIAIVVQMIGFLVLVSLGVISSLNPRPFYVVSMIIGGFIFGIGIVIAGGCLSGTTYRVGEGMIGSIVALVGFFFMILLNDMGLLAGMISFFNSLGQITVGSGGPYVLEPNPTIANILGINPWIPSIIIAVSIMILLIWTSRRAGEKIQLPKTRGELYDKTFKKGWSWWVTGIVIGIIGVLAFPLSAATGRNDALCLVCGWEGLTQFIITGDGGQINWVTYFVFGIIIGAAISAVIAGEFKVRVPEANRLIMQFIGGALIGIGALIAGSCNIGHILSGIPQLALSSIVMGIFLVMGSWLATYFLFLREKE